MSRNQLHICVYHATMAQPLAELVGARLTGARVSAVDDVAADPPDLESIDVLIGFRFPPGLLARMPRLRLLQLTSAGHDQVDDEDLPPGLVVAHAGSIPAPAVAEYALMGMLMFARNGHQLVRQHLQHLWSRPGARLIVGTTVVMLGFGRIGREVAERASALGMQIIAVTRSGHVRVPGVRCVPVEELSTVLPSADFLVVCVPGNPGTQGLVGREAFSSMRPGCCLIDVSRPGVVDTEALVEALGTGRCGGAMLDVVAGEPLAADHPLWREPGVWITPHCAFEQDREVEALSALLIENVERLRSARPLRNVVARDGVPSHPLASTLTTAPTSLG